MRALGVHSSEVDSDRMQRQAWKVDGCGLYWMRMALGGVEAREKGELERIQVARCGQRACPTCGAEAKRRAGDRVQPGRWWQPDGVRWKTFVTLTLPRHTGITPMEAWLTMARWVGRWTAAARRRMKRRWGDVGKEDPRLHYAWVIEPHPRAPEWPHAHVALSMPFPAGIAFTRWTEWGKAAWERIIGEPLESVWHHWSAVKDRQKARSYLVKYLTKSIYTREHYALMYRRRMYGTSLPAEPKGDPEGWQIIEWISETRLRAILRVRGESPLWLLSREEPQAFIWEATGEACRRNPDDELSGGRGYPGWHTWLAENGPRKPPNRRGVDAGLTDRLSSLERAENAGRPAGSQGQEKSDFCPI